LSCPSPTHRQDKITQLLTDYLYDQNYLNIEGFINFRLQDYWENLEGAVKLAVEDYMREKEYDDFVRLLKYFVDAQEPRVGTVNILLMAPGPMQSLDKIVNKTKNIYINGFIFDMVDSEINSEDVLISALISIAPRRVILHVPVPKKVNNVIVTLQKVFGERLKICAGCTCCHNLGEKQ
jgi:putative sporulation protein YtxC